MISGTKVNNETIVSELLVAGVAGLPLAVGRDSAEYVAGCGVGLII